MRSLVWARVRTIATMNEMRAARAYAMLEFSNIKIHGISRIIEPICPAMKKSIFKDQGSVVLPVFCVVLFISVNRGYSWLSIFSVDHSSLFFCMIVTHRKMGSANTNGAKKRNDRSCALILMYIAKRNTMTSMTLMLKSKRFFLYWARVKIPPIVVTAISNAVNEKSKMM